MRKFISFLTVGGAIFVPFLVAAQTTQTIESVGFTVLRILNIVLLIILAFAFIYFILGVIKYMTVKEAKDKETARSQMIYGIVALFVIFSAWGLVKILQNTIFGTTTSVAACAGQPVPNCILPKIPVCLTAPGTNYGFYDCQ